MKLDVLSLRIEELEYEKHKMKQRRNDLDDAIREQTGRIKEMWAWYEDVKKQGKYGTVKVDGTTKVLELPTFSSPKEKSFAIDGEKRAIDGETEQEAKSKRLAKNREDAQKAVDQLAR